MVLDRTRFGNWSFNFKGLFMRIKLCGIVATVLIYTLVICSCRKELDKETITGSNNFPIAHAGRDTIIVLPTDSVQLDGSASDDADGTIKEYLWSKIQGPISIAIDDSNSVKTVAKNLTHGVYKFELKVTDDGGLFAKDTIMITVDSAATINHAPIADAGPDQVISLPTNSVTLDGSNSSDPDNNIISFHWIKISGPQGFTMLPDNNVQTLVTFFDAGTYNFELTVTDGVGLTARDTTSVIVMDSTEPWEDRPTINARLVQVGTLSSGRANLKAGAAGNKILFAGGSNGTEHGLNTRVDIYDIATNSFSTAELQDGNSNREDFVVTSCGNKVLFAGGVLSIGDIFDSQTSVVDIYDASSGSWSTAQLSEARYGIAATSTGDKAIFAGGSYVTSYPNYSWTTSDAVDIYDMKTNSWSTTTLSEARSLLAATVAGNKIYFSGGVRTLNGPSFISCSDKIDVFDIETNSWSIITGLHEARAEMASIAGVDKIFWAGGSTSRSSVDAGAESSEVEIRDLNTGNSSFAHVIPRSNFTAVIKGDNIVFFTSNLWSRNGTHFDIYNISSDTWYTGILDQFIVGAAIIAVNDNIYVAGGFDGGGRYYDKVWRLEF